MPVGSTAWQAAISNIVSTVAAGATTQASSSISTASLASSSSPAVSAQSLLSSTSTADQSLVPEGEYVAPMPTNNIAAPLSDIETREKQRVAAIEQALAEFV